MRILLALLALAPAAAHAADPLPSLRADPSGLTVSGISSGAYMAGQFHLAFSDRVQGAGLVAGGPWGCADGSLAFAMQRCMETNLGDPDPAALLAKAQARAAAGEIPPLANLADDAVYVFSGTKDRTLLPEVAAAAVAFYRLAGVPEARIAFKRDLPAGHAFLAAGAPLPCGASETPYVNDCAGYDQAGAILGQLASPPNTPLNPPAPPQGRAIAFDQAEFLLDPTAHGLALTGYAYVPPACEAGGCRIHIAFHGCLQTEGMVGDAFTRGAGYDRWAETNRLILLYPQTHKTDLNPKACWDWWGYDDPAYATRGGRQMAAVAAMADRLAGETEPPPAFCARTEAGNLVHWQAGRARVCETFFLCAVGSGESLGFAAGWSTLYEHPRGNFSTAPCDG